MTVSEETYLRFALEDVDGQWELVCGRLRQKPDMTAEHNDIMAELGFSLRQQFDRVAFCVRVNAGRVRRTAENFFIPDVFVVPTSMELTQRGTRRLEHYAEPLPLVVEIWSSPPVTTTSRPSWSNTDGAATLRSGAFTHTSARSLHGCASQTARTSSGRTREASFDPRRSRRS